MKIIIRIQGGLGNQLFQYAAAKSLAIKLNAEVIVDDFLLKVPRFRVTKRELKLNLFNCEFSQPSLFDRFKLLITSIPWIRKMQVIYDFLGLQLVDDSNYFDQLNEIKKTKKTVVLLGYFQNDSIFSDFRGHFLNEFSLKKQTEDSGFEKNLLVIHVRRGDYVSNHSANKFHGLCNVAYYKRAYEFISSKVSIDRIDIYTDDPDWVRRNIYFEQNFNIVSDGSLSDAEEVMKMSKGNFFIIANSTFSWWAAWLSRAPDKIVVCPIHWNKNLRSKSGLVPESWVEI